MPGSGEMLGRGRGRARRVTPLRFARSRRPRCRTWLRCARWPSCPASGRSGRLAKRTRAVALGGREHQQLAGTAGAAHTVHRARVGAPRVAFGQLELWPTSRRSRTGTGRTVNDVVVVDLRRRGAALADRARRTARRAARRADPDLGAHRRRRPAPTATGSCCRRRRCSPTSADPIARLTADARGAGRHEGTPPRAAGRAAAGRQPLHPARGVRARRALDVRGWPRPAPAARPGTW